MAVDYGAYGTTSPNGMSYAYKPPGSSNDLRWRDANGIVQNGPAPEGAHYINGGIAGAPPPVAAAAPAGPAGPILPTSKTFSSATGGRDVSYTGGAANALQGAMGGGGNIAGTSADIMNRAASSKLAGIRR